MRNVLMARDIVPRAFACDYTLVADILKRVSPSFRDHRCLSNGQRVVRTSLTCRAGVLVLSIHAGGYRWILLSCGGSICIVSFCKRSAQACLFRGFRKLCRKMWMDPVGLNR